VAIATGTSGSRTTDRRVENDELKSYLEITTKARPDIVSQLKVVKALSVIPRSKNQGASCSSEAPKVAHKKGEAAITTILGEARTWSSKQRTAHVRALLSLYQANGVIERMTGGNSSGRCLGNQLAARKE
jgi:predicted deacylase